MADGKQRVAAYPRGESMPLAEFQALIVCYDRSGQIGGGILGYFLSIFLFILTVRFGDPIYFFLFLLFLVSCLWSFFVVIYQTLKAEADLLGGDSRKVVALSLFYVLVPMSPMVLMGKIETRVVARLKHFGIKATRKQLASKIWRSEIEAQIRQSDLGVIDMSKPPTAR